MNENRDYAHDKEVCVSLMTAVISQAVDDWESCVKAHWKGKRREIRISSGNHHYQTRFDIAEWLKENAPSVHLIFRYSAERMAEEMASEYHRRYEAMRIAEEEYAKVEMYPYWNTKGLQQKKQNIINQVEKDLKNRREKHGKQI